MPTYVWVLIGVNLGILALIGFVILLRLFLAFVEEVRYPPYDATQVQRVKTQEPQSPKVSIPRPSPMSSTAPEDIKI